MHIHFECELLRWSNRVCFSESYCICESELDIDNYWREETNEREHKALLISPLFRHQGKHSFYKLPASHLCNQVCPLRRSFEATPLLNCFKVYIENGSWNRPSLSSASNEIGKTSKFRLCHCVSLLNVKKMDGAARASIERVLFECRDNS